MRIHCAYDELVSPSSLKQHPKNRNKHSKEQIERLCKILEYQGWRYPIKVSKLSGFITSGHGRLMAALKLGLKEVPVSNQDYDSDEQEYADVQSDNAIASWSELDLSGINLDIQDLGPDFDIDLLGIKGFTLDVSEKGQCNEDEVPEHVEPKTKLGDLYTLGNHRLLCGDSTDILQVEKLMNGEKADMVFTDPPYGMNLDTDYSKLPNSNRMGKAKTFNKVTGDNEDFTPELIQTCLGVFSYCAEVFMFGADYYAELLPDKNKGSWVVWDKRVTENFDAMIGSAFELCWSKAKHKREICRLNNTLFSGEADAKNKVHPTQKPIKVVEWFIEKWGKAQDKVVDLFGGLGSTLIACEKTNRKCFMMELDPHYVDIIVARWEKYTGQTAKRETNVIDG